MENNIDRQLRRILAKIARAHNGIYDKDDNYFFWYRKEAVAFGKTAKSAGFRVYPSIKKVKNGYLVSSYMEDKSRGTLAGGRYD